MSAQGTPSKPPPSAAVSTSKCPLKATIPIASVLRQGRGLKSPTYKRGPEGEQASGQRSPGSAAYKGKSKTNCSPSECSSIRRTASLDTIYLKSHWPRESSPDQETSRLSSSPHINKFLAREPPDGCEKVQSKSLEEGISQTSSSIRAEHAPQPCTFKLKPSLESAFQILQPTSLSTDLEPDLPLVPPRPHTDTNQ